MSGADGTIGNVTMGDGTMGDGRPTIGITGATGAVGGLVARLLADSATAGAAAGRPPALRLLARDPSRAPSLPGAEVRALAYGDTEAARDALRGVDVLLLVSAAESVDRLDQHRGVVDAAAAAGVRHVVYTSFLSAAADATFTLARDHFHTEAHLRASGMAVTALQDALYLDFLPAMVGEDGAIRGPAGDGRVAAVARADVARAAAAVLRDPEPHAGATYHLTGPEALTLDEVAQVLTDVTGSPVRYVPQTLDEAYASRAAYGAPEWQVDAWVSTYTAIAAGELAAVHDDVERLTGRPATGLRELLGGPA